MQTQNRKKTCILFNERHHATFNIKLRMVISDKGEATIGAREGGVMHPQPFQIVVFLLYWSHHLEIRRAAIDYRGYLDIVCVGLYVCFLFTLVVLYPYRDRVVL